MIWFAVDAGGGFMYYKMDPANGVRLVWYDPGGYFHHR